MTGKTFKDTNQGSRPDYYLGDASRPTLINDVVQVKIDQNTRSGKTYPNGNMAIAHAEIGTIQQAYEKGMTQGRDMEMKVSGRAVCDFCLSDIKIMANKSGLKSLTIFEEKTGNTLYWEKGTNAFQIKRTK